MIESFKITNYLCYREETEISFLASKKVVDRPSSLPAHWYKDINGKRILRLLLCYGLNGSGKSKMISALNYFREIAITAPESPLDKPKFRPFALDASSQKQPTRLSLTYHIGENQCYCYSVAISSSCILEEELILKGSRFVRLFHRKQNEELNHVEITFGPALDLDRRAQRLIYLATLPNTTVLATFGKLNISSNILRANFNFFANRISTVRRADKSLADRLSTGDVYYDLLIKRVLLSVLRDVGTNIVDYEVVKTGIDISRLIKNMSPIGVEAMLSRFPSGKIEDSSLRLVHKTRYGRKALDIEVESFGTVNIIRIIVALVDVMLGLKSTSIDEIENGIHTKALLLLLQKYLSYNRECQLIVTTHDLLLMGMEGLRRDAIRHFTKDATGSIRVSRIDSIHHTRNLCKAYIEMIETELSAD